MGAPDSRLSEPRQVAQDLVRGAAQVEALSSGGRNSRIFRVTSDAGDFALKHYPPGIDGDGRDRLAVETGALRLMAQYGFDCVPRVEAVDRARRYVLLTWIEGSAVSTVSDQDIDEAAAFLTRVHGLRTVPEASDQPLAAEACLSGAEIERQVAARLARLKVVPGEGELHDFLECSFRPMFDHAVAEAKSKVHRAGASFSDDLAPERRSLVVADFGFHNAIRCNDGDLAFVDFEYFGWDDPVKLTADTLLHPGRRLSAPQRARFLRRAAQCYAGDSAFAMRLDAYLELFGLRWVLILLNEFIPERWHRRVLAGASQTWAEAKISQRERAQEFLATLRTNVEIARGA